jgi:hypothetical protein
MQLLKEHKARKQYDPEAMLKAVCSDLRTICHSSEEQFIELGARLQQFSLDSQELSAQCNKAAALMAGEEVQAAIQNNSDKMKRIRLLITEIKIDFDWTSDVLDNLLSRIREVRHPLEGFGRQILLLHNLGVSTRTSIAELGDDGREFSSLADALNSMAKRVGEHTREILDRLDPLQYAGTDAQSTLHSLKSGSYERLSSALDTIIRHFDLFICRREEFEQIGRNLAAYFNDISNSIMDIVVSLQFHDILRQTLEHVCESLEELINEQTKRCKRWNYAKINAVCVLQREQIEKAYTDFKGAVSSALNSLDRMAVSAEKMVLEVQAMEEVEQELAALVQGLGSEMALVQQYSVANEGLVSRIDSVKDSVSQIYESIIFMGNIEHEMRLIGLNSTIKAVLIGDRGAALVTLSNEIQRCAADISKNGRTVSDVLRQLVDRFEVLSESRSGKDEILMEISRQFHAESASMSELTERIAAPMEQLKITGGSLPAALHAAAENSSLLATADSCKESAIVRLNDLLTETSRMERHFGRKEHIDSATQHIRNLVGKYTIHAERQTHFDHLATETIDDDQLHALEKEKQLQLDTAASETLLWDDPVFADIESTISAGHQLSADAEEDALLDDNIELF